MNASGRLNTCKSRGSMNVAIHSMATGARVRNAYRTCRIPGDSLAKARLIPDVLTVPHVTVSKEFRYAMAMRPIS